MDLVDEVPAESLSFFFEDLLVFSSFWLLFRKIGFDLRW